MQNPFSSITTAGLLLPLDLLTRVSGMDRSLPGMTPADYHVAGSIRLNEAATAAYSRALAYWKSFRKKFNALPVSDTGTTLTRDEWLLPLFDCLGYGRLQTKRSITIDSKDYPISHGWEDHVPIHLLSARLPLDKRTQNVNGAATRSPYSLVQELLNRSSKHRWGFVSNGLKLYVLRDNASLTRSANVEFDLETMMDGEYHADFTVLFLICHQSRLEIQPTPIVDNKGANKKAAKLQKLSKNASKVSEKPAKYLLDRNEESGEDDEITDDEEAIEIEEPTRLGPENCWLEAWTKLAGEQGTRAKERLRDGVQLAIQTFGAGFYTCSSNAALHQRLRSGELSTQDYYRQLLRLVYRLLMLMVAEDKRTESGRNLLHPIDTPANIRDRYAKFYGIARIRKLANEHRGTPHRDLYESLKTTFLNLRKGYAPLGIPGIGSFLFSDNTTPDLDNAQITNEALLDAFRNLCFTEDTTGRGGSVRRAVDFGNLGSEELGSIYESLLELHPEIDSQDGSFVLRSAAGNERKTSGSYYTPTSLINCLLDSALDPVVNQAIDVPDREEAKRRLLNLKVCDPACGSGHFLIAAANRMALHLARLDTQDTEPTTLQIQHAKRQIIGRCIYGVDINEMAVELCKVSLWMEALEPGKPFSFLENHIKCGNSLLGATPRLLNEGIPDEAFNPIEGDDKAICTQLKKDSKRERSEYKSGQGYLFEPFYNLGNMADRFAKLSAADDESLDAIADKQQQYEELIKGTSYLNARFWADTWCAAFVWKKNDTELGKLCPTERKFREIERNPHSASPKIREEVNKLVDQYQFFHWHLAFPNVFVLPEDETPGENEACGWSRGFDIVLGNPPWERVKVQEKEWFSGRRKEIAEASSSASRRRMIAGLSDEDPDLFQAFYKDVRAAEGISHFLRTSARYPYCSRGDVNTFAVFAELNRTILCRGGHSGAVLPPGIATDDTYKLFVQDIVQKKSLKAFFAFTNRGYTFPGVESTLSFAVLILANAENSVFDLAAKLWSVGQLNEVNRVYSLTPAEICSINPNTQNLPIFEKAHDAELVKYIHKIFTVIQNEYTMENPWLITMSSMFHMSNDSGEFKTYEDMISEGYTLVGNHLVKQKDVLLPLYESKLIGQLQHRGATFKGIPTQDRFKTRARTVTSTSSDLAMPDYTILPRYWIDEKSVRQKTLRRWHVGFRNAISAVADSRSVVASIVPMSGVGNSLPLISTDHESRYSTLYIVSYLNSFVADYLIRQKASGGNLNFYVLRQLPIASPSVLIREAPWEHSKAIGAWIGSRTLELTYNAWDLKNFALDCDFDGPPIRWDFDRRFQLRCELDAAYFHFYWGAKRDWGTANGREKNQSINANLLELIPTPRDAVSYIMDTFPIVRRKDEAKYGEYRTKRVILEIYDQMTEIIEANEAIRAANPGKSEEELRPLLRSYQSPLNPPPGPPTDANGNFIPMAEWDPTNWPSHIHPPKDDNLGIAVFRKPEQWGLRGDPYLWREIHQKLIDEGMPADEQQFVQKVEAAFAELTGGTLNRNDSIFVEHYNHGGMSSGYVDTRWWRETGIPLLRQQFQMSVGRQEHTTDVSGDCK